MFKTEWGLPETKYSAIELKKTKQKWERIFFSFPKF